MDSLTIFNVVGCRPNFIKIAPLLKEMNRQGNIRPVLAHTGQHYDRLLSDVFFNDLEIPAPDFCLEVESAPYSRQFGQIMERLGSAMDETRPDLVLVVGDVNSTLAAALTAANLGYPVAHVEAGLRSFDREMPEEINRVLTDAISEFLFATEPAAVVNLQREGKQEDQIFFTGNVMIDSLMQYLPVIDRSPVHGQLGLEPRQYAVVTLHRPSNVDEPYALRRIGELLAVLQRYVPLVCPIHPRTASRLKDTNAWGDLFAQPNFHPVPPLAYIDFMKLVKESLLVITDSGGLQEETTALDIPCLTLRENTERPITLTQGTNQLVSFEDFLPRTLDILSGTVSTAKRPDLWDGCASQRIVSTLLQNADRIKHLYQGVRFRSLCLNTINPALLHQS